MLKAAIEGAGLAYLFDSEVGLVVDHDLPLGRMEPVKTARILRKSPAPGYGHREKQRIEARVIGARRSLHYQREIADAISNQNEFGPQASAL